jgi:hypothetical protein
VETKRPNWQRKTVIVLPDISVSNVTAYGQVEKISILDRDWFWGPRNHPSIKLVLAYISRSKVVWPLYRPLTSSANGKNTWHFDVTRPHVFTMLLKYNGNVKLLSLLLLFYYCSLITDFLFPGTSLVNGKPNHTGLMSQIVACSLWSLSCHYYYYYFTVLNCMCTLYSLYRPIYYFLRWLCNWLLQLLS